MIRMIKNKLAELLRENGYGEVLEREPGRPPKEGKKPKHTLRNLAKRIGISGAALHQMIYGRKNKKGEYETYNPSVVMLDRLCKFLNCKVGDILEFKK